MQSNPAVSVVVPTYKRPEAVLEAVNTVKAQSINDWELIVVDDNPPQSQERALTRELLAEHLSDNIRYIEQQQNSGACAARNRGVKEAKADIIAFLDDDDQWHKDKLRLQLNEFENATDLAINICNIVEQYNGRVEHFNYDVKDEDFFTYFLNRGAGVCCSAIMVRKSYFEAVGGFDINQQSYQDLDLMLRMSKEYDATVLQEYLLFYHLADDGITKNPGKKIAGLQGILDKFSTDLESARYRPAKQKLYSALGDFLILNNQCMKARQAYKTAINHGDSSLKGRVKWLLASCRLRTLFMWLLQQNHRRSIRNQVDSLQPGQ